MVNKMNAFGNTSSKAPKKFDERYYPSEGIAVIRVGDKFGYIDDNEKIISEPQWDRAFACKYGFAVVKKDEKYGVINKAGTVISEPQWDEWDIEYIREGKLWVRKGDMTGYIDNTGKIIGELEYDPDTSATEPVYIDPDTMRKLMRRNWAESPEYKAIAKQANQHYLEIKDGWEQKYKVQYLELFESHGGLKAVERYVDKFSTETLYYYADGSYIPNSIPWIAVYSYWVMNRESCPSSYHGVLEKVPYYVNEKL